MNFTPTIFMTQLLAVMQVLMTLDMPLSSTMALPVTSKPIESTVENLAWQAWIELPPEQKQQVKSRKVTPKSIFTLPIRVECPEGHKQVDTKCIPIVIGSNDVLIDLNALGLLVGNTQTDDLYDYDDMGEEELGNPLPFGSDMPMGEGDKSLEGLMVELKPPTKDEPLKFNIFANKFNIFHEEPLEDYSALSNEGSQSFEKAENVTGTEDMLRSNITAINDLLSEASNISENNFEVYMQKETNSSRSEAEDSLTTPDFRIDAISLPASGFNKENPSKVSLKNNDSSLHFLASLMDAETTASTDEGDRQKETDLETLLQTESFLPMMQQATVTTLQEPVPSLTTVSLEDSKESSSDAFNLMMESEEEMTTLPNFMPQEVKQKQEYTRSVTMNPLDETDSSVNEEVSDTSTLEAITNDDESVETTTPIQLDDTTIIESSSLSLSSSTQATQTKQQLKELLMQQEQSLKDFEELQRMRKGQKDQHVILKKSKVEPVEVLATAATETETTIAEDETETTDTTNLPNESETKTVEELVGGTTKASDTAETVTPLLTVHNENDNKNDRFYYQHIAKHNNEETQSPDIEVTPTTQASSSPTATASTTTSASILPTTKVTEIETIPLTSEIDLAKEMRLINELVKGIRPAAANTLTTIKTMPTTTTTTTEKPTTSLLTTLNVEKLTSSSAPASPSESSLKSAKPTPTTAQIWSKIMPLLTTSSTTTTTPNPKTSTESFSSTTQEESNDIPTRDQGSASSSPRSNRNSKIIRINGFNQISNAKASLKDFPSTSSTEASTTTLTEESSVSTTTSSFIGSSSSSSSSSESLNSESSTENNNTYEPYWWLPVSWRLDRTTTSETKTEEPDSQTEEQPLLLRFWSAYHAPKSS